MVSQRLILHPQKTSFPAINTNSYQQTWNENNRSVLPVRTRRKSIASSRHKPAEPFDLMKSNRMKDFQPHYRCCSRLSAGALCRDGATLKGEFKHPWSCQRNNTADLSFLGYLFAYVEASCSISRPGYRDTCFNFYLNMSFRSAIHTFIASSVTEMWQTVSEPTCFTSYEVLYDAFMYITLEFIKWFFSYYFRQSRKEKMSSSF